jgi:hypothetical protein
MPEPVLTALAVAPGEGPAKVTSPRLQQAFWRRNYQDWMNASRSGLSTSACVVSIPWGKPG